ncbi:RNA binding protein [Cryptosporidium felis]|nr:RNA binding protein [Cryptosporidium felis]
MKDESFDSLLESDSFSILSPELLDEIIAEEFPQLRLGPSVSQVLTTLTNGFLEDIIRSSYLISKQYKHPKVHAEDIHIYLKLKYPSTSLEEFCGSPAERKDNKTANPSSITQGNGNLNINELFPIKLFRSEQLKSAPIICLLELTQNIDNRVSQRLKQINIAKNSIGYERYTTAVQKHERRRELNLSWHPSTPDPSANVSRSCFSGRLRQWKLRLHLWGNLEEEEFRYLINNNLKIPGNYDREKENTTNINFPNLKISPIKPLFKDIILRSIRLDKSRLNGSVISQEDSFSLSQELLLPKLTDLNDRLGTSLLTLFIPDNYRSIQFWKSCRFIRHCDIKLVTSLNYNNIIKYKLSLSDFNTRYDIKISDTQLQKSNEMNDRFIDNLRETNGIQKYIDKIPLDCYRLTKIPDTIFHLTKKEIVSGQSKLLEFRERESISIPCIYPSVVVYCKLLDKLGILEKNL